MAKLTIFAEDIRLKWEAIMMAAGASIGPKNIAAHSRWADLKRNPYVTLTLHTEMLAQTYRSGPLLDWPDHLGWIGSCREIALLGLEGGVRQAFEHSLHSALMSQPALNGSPAPLEAAYVNWLLARTSVGISDRHAEDVDAKKVALTKRYYKRDRLAEQAYAEKADLAKDCYKRAERVICSYIVNGTPSKLENHRQAIVWERVMVDFNKPRRTNQPRRKDNALCAQLGSHEFVEASKHLSKIDPNNWNLHLRNLAAACIRTGRESERERDCKFFLQRLEQVVPDIRKLTEFPFHGNSSRKTLQTLNPLHDDDDLEYLRTI